MLSAECQIECSKNWRELYYLIEMRSISIKVQCPMSSFKIQLSERFRKLSLFVNKFVAGVSEDDRSKHCLHNTLSQIQRSTSSCAANYAEACNAESDKDFVHKMKIVMKELAESKQWLALLVGLRLFKSQGKLESAYKECDELCAIVYSAIRTKEKNMNKGNR